jgi:type III secretory pathway component EscU
MIVFELSSYYYIFLVLKQVRQERMPLLSGLVIHYLIKGIVIGYLYFSPLDVFIEA